jgi:predicted metal-dependent hydrolase
MRRDSGLRRFELFKPAPQQPLETEIETLDGQRVPLRLVVHPRARRVSVRVCPVKRMAIATAPSPRLLKQAAKFAAERAGWIAKELARLPQNVTLTHGAFMPLRGVTYELVFERGRGGARFEPGPQAPRLVVPAPDMDLFEGRLLRFLKNEARNDLTARVEAHVAELGVKYASLAVKELRSRWGSCSTAGALAFSWRLILAPPFVLDYLAAHEVAHLVEMNHSRRFWAQVRKCMPDYERGRRWLREHGISLHSVGMTR